ncbi:hypothetical protein [Paucihalobacter sp.]|uniref:hypothetical protein n=1 Tax=Paucihalobacter sp. TaxID=2850405 RepID=UPI003D1603CB
MKKIIFLTFILLCIFFTDMKAQNYEYKIVTSIESIVPAGLGRSRLIENNDSRDFEMLSDDSQGREKDSSKRKENKIDNFRETNLLNFFSLAGINFQNIASNDALLASMINTYGADGWELAFVTSGVESDSGKGDGQGIFITRFVFKRLTQ